MRRFALGSILAVCSAPASAGIVVDIKLSRSVPDMVAKAIWSDPTIESGSTRPASAFPKSVLRDLEQGRWIIQAEEQVPMERKGSIEVGTDRFLFDNERPCTIGAQEI
jgi:hypothetical protein